MDKMINLDDWYDPTQAAAVISRNSGKVVPADYVRKLARYGKIRKLKINDRASLYLKEDVDGYKVEDRGKKASLAAKDRKAKKNATEKAA